MYKLSSVVVASWSCFGASGTVRYYDVNAEERGLSTAKCLKLRYNWMFQTDIKIDLGMDKADSHSASAIGFPKSWHVFIDTWLIWTKLINKLPIMVSFCAEFKEKINILDEGGNKYL